MASKTKLSEMFDYCSDSSIESEDVHLEASPAVPFEYKCLGQGQAENKPGPVSRGSKSRLSHIFDSCSIECGSSFGAASLAIKLTDAPEAESLPSVSSQQENEVKSEGFTAHHNIPTQRQPEFSQDKGIAREFRDSLVLEISSDSDDEQNNEVINFKDSAKVTDESLALIPEKNGLVENSPPLKRGSPSKAENSLRHKLVSPVKLNRPRKTSASIIDDDDNMKYEVFGAISSTLIDSDDDSAKQPKRMKRGDNLKVNADVNEAGARIGEREIEDAKQEKVRLEEQAELFNSRHLKEGNEVLHGASSLLPKEGNNLPGALQGGFSSINQDDEDFPRDMNRVIQELDEDIARDMAAINQDDEDFARDMAAINHDDEDFARDMTLSIQEVDEDIARDMAAINQDDEDFARYMSPINQDDEDFARYMSPINQDDEYFARDMALAIQESLRSSFPRGAEQEAHTGSSFLGVQEPKKDSLRSSFPRGAVQEAHTGSNFIRVPEPKKDVTTLENKPKRSQIFDSYPDSLIEPEDIPSEPNLDFEDDQFNLDMVRAIQASLTTSGSCGWAGPTTANTYNWTAQAPSSSYACGQAEQGTSTSFSYRQQAITNSVGHRGQAASTFRGQAEQSTSTSRGCPGCPVPNVVNKAWEAQRNDLQNFGISEEERNRMLGDFGNNNIYGGNKTQDDHRRARAISKAMKSLHTSLETMPAEGDVEEQPLSLRPEVELFPHQKHALAWLLWRETQHPPGGILADDMGLGKTLTMISLVLKHRELEAMNGSQNEEDTEDTETFGTLVMSKTTLIVCPASLLDQWKREVETKVKSGKLKVLVYHGSNRRKSCKELAKFDIVITTYGTVQVEVKSQLGDSIEKDVEIKMADMGAAEDLCSTKGYSELLGVAWQRIILDEAHIIRNPKSLTSQAICRLRAERRWCLTGTPIHNKELDLYSLLRFLRCSPFDEYKVWKRIENKSVTGVKRMATLVKSLLLRRMKETKVPLTGKCIVELPQKIIVKLKVDLTPQEREVYDKVFSFAQEMLERFMSQKIEKERVQELGYRGSRTTNKRSGARRTRTNNAGGTAGNGGATVNNRSENDDSGAARNKNPEAGNEMEMPDQVQMYHILVLLLRLRQICCHPRLIKSMLESDEDDVEDDLQGEDGDERDIIYPGILSLSNQVFDDDYVSAKVSIVIEELSRLKKQQDETGFVEKIVIVSQWTKLLNLVKIHVEDIGMSYSEIKGKIPVKDRGNIVEEFNKNPCKPEVMFLSLAAGGVGLNLVGANHLFLLDMHWNPQQEAQACDRIYRVGQIREVKIHKFLIEDSIEERVLLLQEKKLKLANDVLTGAKRSGANKLTLDDLKMLFQIK